MAARGKESHLYDHKWVYGQNSWEIQTHQVETFQCIMSQKKITRRRSRRPHTIPSAAFPCLPNPSNSKAACTTACQRNQIQAVEKHSSQI